MSDHRYWITNPAGHRAFMEEVNVHQTGDVIQTPLGEAVFINATAGTPLDLWICDLCNGAILSRWGTEPFPVAAEGTDALCTTCRESIERGPRYSDITGEPIPHTRAGPWPPNGCGCPPCQNTTQEWAPFLLRGFYGIVTEPG